MDIICILHICVYVAVCSCKSYNYQLESGKLVEL